MTFKAFKQFKDPGHFVALGLCFWALVAEGAPQVVTQPKPVMSPTPFSERKIRAVPVAPSVPSPMASPTSVPVALPSPYSTDAPKISPELAKSLLSEFKKAQASELKALDHQQKLEIAELKASQKARQKEWEQKEKEARHQYFNDNTHGPDRRTYVRDFLQRRKAFLAILSDERNQRSRENAAKMQALKQEQSLKLKLFQQQLSWGQRPNQDLWPRPGS